MRLEDIDVDADAHCFARADRANCGDRGTPVVEALATKK